MLERLQTWKERWLTWKENQQNLISVIIVLAGLFVGSLFVDVGQLITGSGFSAHAIRDHDLIVTGGKTWVAYTDPKIPLKVISDPTCTECDPSDALLWLHRIVPTVESERIDAASDAGIALTKQYSIVSLPAFVFDASVKDTEFYAQAEPLFREVDKHFIFDMHRLGLPIGKYLVAPEVSDHAIILGNADAPVTLTVFSDFECQYCNEYYQTIKKVLKEYEGKIRVVWKHFPLPTYAGANNAAAAAQCAADQGHFEPYADLLFNHQKEWSKKNEERLFIEYARRTIGVDTNVFTTCLSGTSTKDKVDADEKLALSFGLESAPSTFIDKDLVTGSIPEKDLHSLIDKALTR